MFDLVTLQGLIAALDAATTPNDKGNTLEKLASYLFSTIDGIEVRERNVNTAAEEIDILLWNARSEPALNPWESVILVECKNWSAPVPAAVLDSFITKLGMRHLKTGILVAANGVTGDFENGNNADIGAVRRIEQHLNKSGTRVIVIRMSDIRALTSVDDLVELIKDRYCKVYMQKVF